MRAGDDGALVGERIDHDRLGVDDRHQVIAQHLLDVEFGFRP
jgi:aminoglycoside phosphotransferase